MNKQHFLSIFKLKAVLATTISLALKKKIKALYNTARVGQKPVPQCPYSSRVPCCTDGAGHKKKAQASTLLKA